MKFVTFILCALTVLPSALWAERASVTVFAAASLRGALDDMAKSYSGTVQVSYGGSGTMARQVAAGAPADAVVLASADWMSWLLQNADIIAGSRRDIATNSLVLIGPADTTSPGTDVLTMLGAEGRLAMGQRDAVPAGIYAREWLQSTGQWDSVMDRLAETDNVRAALALVARGQTPVGIVYASDAAADKSVRVLLNVPRDTHSPITYPGAALTPAGQAFLEHLATPASQVILASHGFGPVPE